MRALIPGYRALTKGHFYRRLGGERLKVAVEALEPDTNASEVPVNPIPHPFG